MVTGEVKTGVWVVPVTTVIVAVSEQPFEFVKVMVVVPVVNPLTTPEFEIVATEVLEDTQAFELAGVEVADNVMDSPAPTDVEPEIIYFEKYGEILSTQRPDYISLKKISEAFKELKSIMPAEPVEKDA